MSLGRAQQPAASSGVLRFVRLLVPLQAGLQHRHLFGRTRRGVVLLQVGEDLGRMDQLVLLAQELAELAADQTTR